MYIQSNNQPSVAIVQQVNRYYPPVAHSHTCYCNKKSRCVNHLLFTRASFFLKEIVVPGYNAAASKKAEQTPPVKLVQPRNQSRLHYMHSYISL